MNKYFVIIFIIFITIILSVSAMDSSDDFFSKDPQATYDENFKDIEIIIKIPGYKLDPKSALAISIGKKELENAKHINREILKKAKSYIKYRKLNLTNDYYIYAAKELENYFLLYFNEPKLMDGGFELIYSKKLKKIIGCFSAGYKG